MQVSMDKCSACVFRKEKKMPHLLNDHLAGRACRSKLQYLPVHSACDIAIPVSQ